MRKRIAADVETLRHLYWDEGKTLKLPPQEGDETPPLANEAITRTATI